MKNTYRINTLLLCLFLFCYQGLSANYLCFTAEQAGSSVRYVNGVDNKPKVEYSFNGTDWFDWPAQTTITLENKDDKVYVRGDNPDGFSHETISTDISELNNIKCSFFQMKGLIAASGNVMSLIDGEGITTTIPCENCFNRLFYQCRALTTPPELPATELAPGCYNAMFFECTGLKETPELPATKLAENCYLNMFGYCSNLTVAPELPATTLENSCYANMLAGTSITEAPKLPATEMKRYCYSNMFAYCEKLTKAPDLPSTVLDGYCYWQMFLGCVSLIEAPELPATNLVENCYQAMFKGCINLSYIKMDVLTLDNDLDATKNWVDGIDGEGVFIFPCGSKYDKHGFSEVPENFKIKSSPIVVFVNPDETELYRDTIGCDVVPEYKGETPTYGEGLVFKEWDKELTVLKEPDVYYFTAVYEEGNPETGNWLCFTAETDDSEVWYENENGNEVKVQYSLNDGATWISLSENEKIVLKKGEKVYIKGDNPNGFSRIVGTEIRTTCFKMTGLISASGSVMSLLDGNGSSTVIPNESCFISLFMECSSLTKAPELPATSLRADCYSSMFYHCTNLVEPPVLPATTLAFGCYYEMFRECNKLQVAPELPATTLAKSCYSGMFADCISLISAPKLPATELAIDCYSGMFAGCQHLTEAPELPATTLAKYCYHSMFRSCSDLTDAPALPATTLATSCYYAMFDGCRSLTKAPELPATSLMKECYLEMFMNCPNLNYIKVGIMSLDNDVNATLDWVKGIDGEGVFIFPCGSKYDKHGVAEVPENFTIISSPIVVFQNPDGEELYRDTIACDVVAEYKGDTPTYGEGLVFKGWDKELTIHEIPDTYYYTAVYEDDQFLSDNWLCFTAEEANSVVQYLNVGGNNPNVMYSIDGGKTWESLSENEEVKLVMEGDKVYLKGDNPTGFSQDEDHYTHIWTTGAVSASGSVMSLIDGKDVSTEIPNDYCFYHLFANSPALVTAPELPATELKKSCYEGMFENCTILEKVPALPATTLEERCYKNMFGQCYKIKETPVLPATTLANECYYTMFSSCVEVTEAPLLPATVMAESCYYGMFSGCYGLTEAPALPATELAYGCYRDMFWDCWNLEVAPALPATELAESCYMGMFTDCGNLTKAPALPATVMKDLCYSNMFSGCEKLLEAPELPATKLAMDCYNSMFLGCENLTMAPELPAQELAPTCYMYMFEGCSNLIYIKVGVLSLDNSFDATTNWVAGIDGFGVFVFPCGSKYDKHGRSEVPDNFTIISSPVVVFQNPDGEELYRDTIGCDVLPVYRGETPTYKEGLVFKGWDPELTIHPEPDTFYYTAVYEKELTPIRDVSRCLCFTIEEAGSWIWYESPDDHIPNMEYSIDSGVTWQPFVRSETWGENKLVFDNVGDKIYVRGVNPDGFSFSREHPTQFHISGKVAASGSVMSLIDGEGYYNVIPSEYCFSSLFEACSLTQAPELTATTLTKGCYDAMFNGCTKLTQAPALPATTLVESCYQMMFAGCEMLQMAPELLSTTLADSCYSGMFYICESLKTAPALPATTLASYCYSFMFAGCHRLTEAPELPATELKTGCYEAMFLDCSRLNYIKVGVMTLDNDFDATLDWVQEIDGEGVFIFPCGSKYDKHGISEVPDHFKIISSPVVIFQNPDGEELYRDTIGCDVLPVYRGETPTYGDGMVFKGWDKELTIHPEPDTFYYTAVYEEGQTSITDVSKCLCFTAEKANSYVYYQNHGGNSPDVQYSIDEGRTWQSWGENEVLILKNVGEKIYVRGTNPDGFSHMANLQKSDGEEVGQFTNFKMSGEIAASGSVMSLIDGKGESLVIPCDYCFAHLFNSTRNPQQHEDVMTTALTKAPELPATTLTMGCYLDMFGTCSLLKEAPVLPATELASSCYVSMFNNCRSLEIAPALPATKLSKYCYEGMFSNSGIVVAPELPATDLMDSCYWGMFRLCKNMESAPELLATELKPGCYEGMFAGCSNLNYIKVGVMTLDNDFAATNEWVTGVNGPGTFIFPCGSKYDKHGVSEVPDNFKIISSPVVIFQNPDGEELYRDTIGCDVLPEYKGETPTYGEELVFKGWDKELTVHPEPDTFYYTAVYEEQAPITDVSKCLCFTAEEAGSEVSYRSDEKANISIQYSIDDGRSWQTLKPNEIITFGNIEDKVYLKGNNTNGLNGDSEGKYWTGCQFIMSGAISASGSVMSLIDGMGISSIIPNKHCFSYLFANCTSLTQAPELPATTLTDSCYLSMFMGCYSLKQAPELPATTLLNGCYQYMFEGCLELTKTPKLSATTLAKNCYHGMFYDCEKLTQIADLPAKTLADYCYSSMFSRCVGLTQAPALPAMELADGCYNGMFYDCNNLIEAPQLPATQLAAYCYSQMFENCAGMKNAPELPASELTDGCYSQMFKNCSSLNYIKVGVMSLDNDFAATNEWVAGVNGPGTFIFPCGSKYDKHGVSEVPEDFKIISSPVVVFQNPDGEELYRDTIGCDVLPEYKGETPTYGEGLVFKGWDKELTVHPEPDTFYYTAVYEEGHAPITDVSKCLCFTAEMPVSKVWYENYGNLTHLDSLLFPDLIGKRRKNNPDVQYSIDEGRTWQPLLENEKIKLNNVGDKVYIRGYNPDGFSHSCELNYFNMNDYVFAMTESESTTFKMSGSIAASGSVMSLIDGVGTTSVIPNDYCFYGLFKYCDALTQTPELPATTLTKGCYEHMFEFCSALTKASELPALTMADSCYWAMFSGCTNLIAAPQLPSVALACGCYGNMFDRCTSLTEAPALPATNMAVRCYNDMFCECASLKEAPELPATILATECYSGMFSHCISLTAAPQLPATNMAVRCYNNMFLHCISLTETPKLIATVLDTSCYSDMFYGCSSLMNAPELPATTLSPSCYAGMFGECTSLTKAPELPAITLKEYCYYGLFRECSSLTQAPELPATTLAEECYGVMFSGCMSLTEAPELPATELANACYRWMFSKCASLTTAPELPATELVEECYDGMFFECENLNYIKVGVMSLDNNFEYGATSDWVFGVNGPGVFIFPCGSTYDKHGVSEVPNNFEILRGPVTVIYQNPDSTELWRETIDCGGVPAYQGETPSMGDGYFFLGWDKEFTSVEDVPVYYITAVYEDLNKYTTLHLTVDDDLFLVLPGGSETIGYELLEGGGSRYEIWYNGAIITEGTVTNDSTVQLICPEDFTPGAYAATLVMFDGQNGRGACDFVFHVMLKDDPTNSYYVKVWNDVVICRNGDNKFVSYQWYKNRKIVEGATLQYYSDVELLDGEYLIYVTDQSGKSYFIEPKQFERVEASYSIVAEPSIVNQGSDFTVVVSGVEPEQLKNARIVVYRNDGVVVNILDDVETENEMHLAAIGDYVIVLTVNDGKNANCKVLIK